MSKITVGILGGMGPMSTVEFMRILTEKTPVQTEADHFRLLVDSRPQIPSRPAALLHKGPSPIPMMRESARLLEKWGAALIVIPCNTAHAFHGEIQAAVNIEVLNMIALVAKALENTVSQRGEVALLATSGAIEARIFHDRLPGFRLLTPTGREQDAVVEQAIRAVKLAVGMDEARLSLTSIVRSMTPSPAAVVAGCTEIELALSHVTLGVPLVRPLDLLASEVVRRGNRDIGG